MFFGKTILETLPADEINFRSIGLQVFLKITILKIFSKLTAKGSDCTSATLLKRTPSLVKTMFHGCESNLVIKPDVCDKDSCTDTKAFIASLTFLFQENIM